MKLEAEEIRLQKYLAYAGVASRRKAEELIATGQISVNGKIVTEMGIKVSGRDKVYYNGKPVVLESEKIYIMLNKPEKVVSTADDQFGRKSVVDCITGVFERIYPIGRLDYDTSGMILLTNDGDFANKLMHPSHSVGKTYHAITDKPFSADVRTVFEQGIEIDGKQTRPAEIESLGGREYKIVLHEGRNREIRRLFEAAGHRVLKLKRLSIGNLELGDLKEGEWRYLTEKEVAGLRNMCR